MDINKLRRRHSEEQSEDGIDMSPLIDCVFILLIFFMVTTTFNKDMKLDINRPTAQSSTVSNEKALKVFIDNSGDVYLDGLKVRVWVLQSKVKNLLRDKSNKSVLVVTDESVPAKVLVDVVDQCRLAGSSDVGVSTNKEAGA